MVELTGVIETVRRRAYVGIALARRLWHSYPPEAAAREVAEAARRQENAANAFIRTANQLASSAEEAARLFDKKGRCHD